MAGKIAMVFPKSSFYAPIVNLIVRSMIIPNWSNLRASELVQLIRQYYRLVKIMRIILPRAKLNVLRFVFMILRLVPIFHQNYFRPAQKGDRSQKAGIFPTEQNVETEVTKVTNSIAYEANVKYDHQLTIRIALTQNYIPISLAKYWIL